MKKIVVLTGAGMSAENGLKTFRDHDGLWHDYRVEEVATPEAIMHLPERQNIILILKQYRSPICLTLKSSGKWREKEYRSW